MKKKDLQDDRLITMLKKSELDKPLDRFSERLIYMVVNSYKQSYANKYKKEEWLGKCILAILIFFNLLMLYFLNPFNIEPVLSISISGFIFGFGLLIFIIRLNRKITL